MLFVEPCLRIAVYCCVACVCSWCRLGIDLANMLTRFHSFFFFLEFGNVEALESAFGKSGSKSGGGDAYDSDEEGQGRGGQGGVQCAQQ